MTELATLGLELAPPPSPCCILGLPAFDAYARALRRQLTGGGSLEETAHRLRDVVEHLIDMHRATGPELPACAGCVRFRGEPAPDYTLVHLPADIPRPPMSPRDWEYERRAHHVCHTVAGGGPLELEGAGR